MKKASVFLGLILISFTAIAQTWTLDKGHSKAGFTVSHHMISEVDGYFRKYDAKFTSAKADFSDAVFEFTAETASINTENEVRDGHLKGEDLFNAEKFPTITFKSTSFTRVMGTKYKMMGNITIKGVSKMIALDVIIGGPQMNERAKKLEMGIKATGILKRSDFAVGTKLPTTMVSDEVELRVLGEFQKDE